MTPWRGRCCPFPSPLDFCSAMAATRGVTREKAGQAFALPAIHPHKTKRPELMVVGRS